MNSRNMEQLIEKYKREMLSYSMRSAPPTERSEPTPIAQPQAEAVEEEPMSAEETMPEEMMPEDTVPEETMPEEMIPEDTVPEETMPEEMIPEDTAPEELSPEEMVMPFFLDEPGAFDDEQQQLTPEEGYEPALEAMAVMKKEQSPDGRSDDYSSPLDVLVDSTEEKRLSMLRESCRKIAAGEAEGTDAQKQSCTELYNFFAVNTELGSISVETYASDQVFGVGSARVMIFIPLKSGSVMVFDGLTDGSGSTVKVELPAPPKELSLSPGSKSLPYALYTILVEHPNYVRAVYYDVPVFEGIESIQPVRMLTKVEGENVPDPIVVQEREPTNL